MLPGADVGSVFTTGEFGPNDGTWVEQTLTGDVPAGARQVRVQLLAHNHFGSNTTYGFDDLSLSLSVRRPVPGDLLRYDGSAWVGVTAAEVLADAGLGDLGDVDASDTTAGYVLTREADGSFALHAVGGGSASTKVFDGASDGGDTYTLSPSPQGTVLVWVDGLLETDYSVAGATLTFGTAPPNGAAIVAWDIGGGGPPLRHRRLLPGPARGRRDPAPVRRLARLHAACRSDRQPGLRRHCTDRSGRPRHPEERRLDRHHHLRRGCNAPPSSSPAITFAAGDRLTVLAPAVRSEPRRRLAHLQGPGMSWYDPGWLYRQKITIDHTRVAEDLTDFPALITHAVVQASLFTHARSDGADIVVTASNGTTRLKRELVTYDAIAGELELYVRIPSLSAVADTDVYVYYGNAGAAETNDADTWNADYGIVYHLREDPAGIAPQARDSTANAVHGTYDVAGATALDNTLWGGKCILFDNGPRLRVDDNPAIENADRITIEAWVNTLSWPTRAVVCRKEAATSSTTTAAASPGISSGPTTGCSTTSPARSGTAAGATSWAPTTRTPAPTISASTSTAPVSRR